MKGNDIDLFKFPVPKWYPKDGGRFIGTAHYIISKDPDSGWVNLGTYRSQLLDKNQARDPVHQRQTRRYHAQEIPGPEKTHAGGLGDRR